GTGDKTLVEIRVDTDGDGEADDAVTATDEHPIWVADLARVSIEDAFGANLSDTTELEMATIAPAADADGSGSGGGGPPPNGQSDATTYGDEAIAWGVSDAGDSGDAADQLATVEKPLSGQWVNAIDLKVGQLLRTSAGTWIQVEAVEVRSEHATVYNFTVADFHTYHVVAGGIDFLTHNDGCDPLEEYADSQREVGGTKFASEYTSPSGEKYYSSNKHGNAGKIDSMP